MFIWPYFTLRSGRLVDEDGVERFVRTSSASTMAQLLTYRRLGAFPLVRRIAQSDRPTASGFYPIWLEDPTA